MPTEAEIERARRAIMDAPKTETGLVLPPHIAQEREREQQAAAAPRPNRAQRRAQEKQARKAAREAARRERMQPEARELVEQGERLLQGMSEPEIKAALGMLKSHEAAIAARQERRVEQMERDDHAA